MATTSKIRPRSSRSWSVLAALLLASLVLAACPADDETPAPGDDPAAEPEDPGDPDAEWPDKLVFGFMPFREADVLIEEIRPLTEYMTERLGVPVEGIVPTDPAGMVEALGTGHADIAAFGPFTLIQAVDRYNARIILQAVRGGSAFYYSQWMTNNPDKYCDDEPVEDEKGYLWCNGTIDADEDPVPEAGKENVVRAEGEQVAFVAPTSASGYIFPALLMIEQGMDPETDVQGFFTETHDASTLAVYMGDVEVGVGFWDSRDTLVSEFPDIGQEVVVFALSVPVPNQGYVVRDGLPEDLVQAIIDSLMEFAERPGSREVLLESFATETFVLYEAGAYDPVREAARHFDVD